MRRTAREAPWRSLAPAVIVTVTALLPGRTAAFVAATLALLAAADLLLRWRRADGPFGAPSAAAGAIVVATLLACLSELAPLPESPVVLARGAAEVEARWREQIDALSRAVSDLPPPGSDYGWIERRAAELGPDAGLAVMTRDASDVLAWRGRTTSLSESERVTVAEEAGEGDAVLVLRRGLTLRAAYASASRGGGELIVAEVPLPVEPDPGPLASGLPHAIEARVRWEAAGEGVRAEVGALDPSGAWEPGLWSLVPLMDSRGRLAGRMSLGVLSRDAWRDSQATRRRAIVSLAAAAALAWLAFTLTLGAWAILAARAVSLGACRFLASIPALHSASVWPFGSGAAPETLYERLWHTPLDGALTGLALVAAIGLLPGRLFARAKSAMLGAGIAAAGAAATFASLATIRHGLAPGELMIAPFDDVVPRALVIVAMASPVWAGALVVARSATARARRAVVLAALAGGLVAGALHGVSLPSAARRVSEDEVAPLVEGRARLWTSALLETLEIAVPARGSSPFTPDRDAIDLWWNSPLGRLGLAGGVWKYESGPDPAPVDAFVTGLPPVSPVPRLPAKDRDVAGPFARTLLEPELEAIDFVEGVVEIMRVEVQRPDGGSWVAAVLVEPGNLPGRGRADPLRGARAVAPRRPALRPAGLEPRLAWFDESGALAGSDLDAGPPAPVAPPPEPRWRTSEVEGRRVELLEIPDRAGTVTIALAPPGALALAALAIAWAALLTLLAGGFIGLVALATDARGTLAAVVALVRRIATHFRGQLAVSFVLVGLLALFALAGSGRGAARRQAERLLTNDGADKVHFARRLVESSLTLDPGGPLDTGPGLDANQVAAWMSTAIGEDLAVWRSGVLLATSRPDLVRAGLWPERLPGGIWESVSPGRRPLALDSLTPAASTGARRATVAHGPYRSPDGRPGVVSISLGTAGLRFEEELADIDRALLVSTALLLGLSILLLVPLTRRMTAPLAELERATARIAGGDFAARVPDTGYEETRALARAFRVMTESLSEQRASLERRRLAIETLIESLPVAVVAFAGDGSVWTSNPRARELLSAPEPAGDGESASPLGSIVHALRDAKGEAMRTVELSGGDQDAAGKRVRVAAIDIPGLTEGEPARLVVVEDLTDALRAERLTAWAEMARRIAHEIKNPLTPISLMVEHVRRLAERDDERLHEVLEECLSTIADQVGVLRETSREFSDYARLLVPRPSPIDLPAELRRWLAPYITAPPAGTRLALEGNEEPLSARADPRLLRRAVVNLVDNALAAVREGGRVTVRYCRCAEGEFAARIDVEDSGPGIDPQRVAALFEPDVTTRETGSGLGLPIVREAVEALGGRLDVDPRPGRGACFSILLPG